MSSKGCQKCGATTREGGKKGLSKCKGCNKVKYCSVECQQSDWKKHKLVCKSFQSHPCWICKKVLPDKPVYRDCACRGSKGYGHLDCFVVHTKQFYNENDTYHEVCPLCNTFYRDDTLECIREAHIAQTSSSDHLVDRLDAKETAAMLNWEKGHLEKAYIGFNQILAMIDEYPELEELVGWGRAKVALHVCALAKSMGRYEEALGILKELDNLKHSRRVCFTPQLDFEMNQNYADVCSYLGDTVGLKYGEKALKIVRRIVDENPEDFCSLIDCMVNLASDYLDDGQPGKAVELGTEAYKLTKKKYGPNNEDTVEMKANMERLQKYSKEPDVVAESIAAKEFGKRRPVAILADVPAEWSGRMVYVHHFDHDSLMYRVELRSIPNESRWMNFAPSNVIFQPGTEILIHSLTQAQELNLKEGAVESFSTKRGRFKVNLQEPRKTISVKPENIIPQRFFDYQYDIEKARILARLLTAKNDN